MLTSPDVLNQISDQFSKVGEQAQKMIKRLGNFKRQPTAVQPEDQPGSQRLLSESDLGVDESYVEEG